MRRIAPLILVFSVLAVLSSAGLGAPEDGPAPAALSEELSAIRSMQARGEYDEALSRASLLIEGHPDNLMAHIAYQDLRVARGEVRSVQGEYSYDARKKDATADEIFLYGRLLEGKKAVATLERALHLDPDHFHALCAIGAEFTDLGRYGEARDALERAERLNRSSAIPANALGWLSEATGDRVLAEQYYRVAIDLAPNDPLPRLNLGILLIGLARPLEAEVALDKAAALSPADPMPLLGIGMVKAAREDFEGAIESYRKAVELKSNNAASLNLLANAYLGLEQYDLAKQALMRALALDTKNVTTLLNLGYLNLLQSEPDEAMTWVQRALRVDPDSAEGYYFLGLCNEYNGKVKGAEKAYRKAASLDEGNPDYPRALGVLYTNQGRAKEAVKAFEFAVELSEHSPDALLDLGFAWVAADEAQKAVLCFLEVVDQDPDNLTAWMNIGLIYQEKLRRHEPAIRAYEEYVKRGGTDPRVKEWLELLRR